VFIYAGEGSSNKGVADEVCLISGPVRSSAVITPLMPINWSTVQIQ
jgi:hypothetical protein